MTTVTLKGTPYQIMGELPKAGTKAPDFTLTKMDLSEVSLKDFHQKKIILNIFPSLDTPTCALGMKRFNDIAKDYPSDVVLCVSVDLPFAQKRFCQMESLSNLMPVSTFRHPDFAKLYGVGIVDGPLKGLLTRAVVVIDGEGKVVYSQLVKEVAEEVNYAGLNDLL